MPIPDSVIEIVEELISGENMTLLQNGSPIFEWASGVTIDDKDITDEEIRGDNIEDEQSESPTLE